MPDRVRLAVRCIVLRTLRSVAINLVGVLLGRMNCFGLFLFVGDVLGEPSARCRLAFVQTQTLQSQSKLAFGFLALS